MLGACVSARRGFFGSGVSVGRPNAVDRRWLVTGTMAGTVTRRPGQYRANAGRRFVRRRRHLITKHEQRKGSATGDGRRGTLDSAGDSPS
jgi:hypothetical protein